MPLTGKKVIILVEEMFNLFEFWYPYYRLKEAGARVTVVGSGSADKYTSKAGLPVSVDTSAERVAAGDFSPITPVRRFHDEFSQLSVAMNHMMIQLAHRHERHVGVGDENAVKIDAG